MLRIGIAASKMSKGSLSSYNLYVILIACLFSLFIFFLVSVVLHALKPADFHTGWVHMFKICLVVLAFVVGILNIVAILKNIQFTKNKI